MKIFEVNNEFELGNAIWAAKFGDKINLNKGAFGYVPVKFGVDYEFKDSSCSQLIGLGLIMDQDWSANSFENEVTKITNPKIITSNVKIFYVFRTKLTFNSRFDVPTSFIHANGVIINILGNDRNNIEFGGFGQKAEEQLPKAVVDIVVPSLEGYNILASEQYFSTFSTSVFTEDEINTAKIIKQKIENLDINYSIGINLNDFEYKALWALNTFIKKYCRLFDLNKIKGFDINEFKDGLLYKIIEKFDNDKPFNSQSAIGQFSNAILKYDEVIELSNRFLSYQEYSISDYTLYHLNHLNYSFATIGMYQEFEEMLENTSTSIYKTSNLNKKDKWLFIEFITNDLSVKKYLAEMINARNWITHSKKVITEENGNINKLKTDWNAEVLNEYQIYALKRPFYWHKALNDFKLEFDKKFPS